MKNKNSPQDKKKLNRIFLVGMPASGKTTLGKEIAQEKGFQFIDLDNYIEEKNQTSIKNIFETQGEESFRKLERDALEDMLKFEKVIVATGGGTPCFFDNMEFINENGQSIFLNNSLETLVDRILNDKTEHRPLYQNKSREELLDFLEKLYLKRSPFYKKADIIHLEG